jgi:hypothetical protein
MGVASGFGPARGESPRVRESRSVESLWEPSKVTGLDLAVMVAPTGKIRVSRATWAYPRMQPVLAQGKPGPISVSLGRIQ